jgi:hypothetical protein
MVYGQAIKAVIHEKVCLTPCTIHILADNYAVWRRNHEHDRLSRKDRAQAGPEGRSRLAHLRVRLLYPTSALCSSVSSGKFLPYIKW